MDSTRPIRALTRGLDALTVLNARGGATVSEVALEVRLPRTTVYRILQTLCDAGFAARDPSDDRYRPTRLVRSLSLGVGDERWVSQIAAPCIAELGREIVWPVSLATLRGSAMMVREATDHATPLAWQRHSAGFRMPLLGSAPGLAHLAFCPSAERDGLLDELARSNREEDEPARTGRAALVRMLDVVKSQGHATATHSRRPGDDRRSFDEVSASVPVTVDDRVLAVVTVRFIPPAGAAARAAVHTPASAAAHAPAGAAAHAPAGAAAPALKASLDRFLPRLRQCAAGISTLFSEQHARTQTSDAADAAA
jgi:IclR family mhp operon transcriptional activator